MPEHSDGQDSADQGDQGSQGPSSSQSESPSENPKERIDRELIELLNELRIALPGVQVLFAFLLSVPFANRFADTSDFQRDAYFVTLISAAVASGLLMAPAAQHRALFRAKDKERLLRRSNRYAVIGFIVLAVAIAAATVLVVDFLFGRLTGMVSGLGIGLLLFWWWTALPLIQRRRVAEISDLATDKG